MSAGAELVWLATTRKGATFHHVTGTVRKIADTTRCGRSTRTGVATTAVVAAAYDYQPCDRCWPGGAP
jgi:hypothetical protein